MTSRSPRLLAAAALVVAALIALAGPAVAHAALVSASPGADAELEAVPGQIRLEFNEKVNRPSFIAVTAPDGSLVVEGEATIDERFVIAEVPDTRLAGVYRVDYRVTSADAHQVTGAYKFTVLKGEHAPREARSEATDAPLESQTRTRYLAAVVGGLFVVLLGIVGWAVLRGERADDEPPAGAGD